MLELARKRNVYKNLRVADLNVPLAFDDSVFHAVTIVGLSLHFPPEAYHEIGRVLSPGGLVFSAVMAHIRGTRNAGGLRFLCEIREVVVGGENGAFKPLPVSEPGLDYRIFIHQIIDK